MIDTIAKTFNVPEVIDKPKEYTMITKSGSAREDFETARDNLLQIIKNGNEAIDDLIMLANQSQAARYYETLASHLKTMVEANRQLLELQVRIRDLDAIDEKTGAPQQVQNNLFIGTSDDLLKIIKGV